ncbi:hypothetical protein KIN20_021884 [Parelaphostrongylus tenuis]|uniref:Uncharacterized protein n=1 Tax=Parelaphostrongylus tenuis TaxID=148309 RepID=A0AAD5MUS7_PARTN|nr:hypothetical protein KIN20_021884 [Parelaphostrongylus tenuis]
MVVVQVELENLAQVQDLVTILLSRSYTNFRVTNQESFASGNTSSQATVGLSQSSNGVLCRSPAREGIPPAQNAVSFSASRDEKPLIEAPTAPVGLIMWSRSSRNPLHRFTRKSTLVLLCQTLAP